MSAHNGCGTWHAPSMLAVATIIITTSITIITITTFVVIMLWPQVTRVDLNPGLATLEATL